MGSKIQTILTRLVILALIVFALNLLIDNPYFHGLLRIVINQKITTYTDLRVDFHTIGIRLFPPQLNLYGLKVTTGSKSSEPVLEAALLKAEVSLWSIIIGKPHLNTVEVNELDLSYPFPASFKGVLKYQDNDSKKSKNSSEIRWPPKWDIPIDNIVLTNSKINFVLGDLAGDGTRPLALRFEGLNLDLTHDGWHELKADVEVNSFDCYVFDAHLIKSAHLLTEVKADTQTIKTEYLELQSNDLNFTGMTSLTLNYRNFKMNQFDTVHNRSIMDSLTIVSELDVTDSNINILGRYLELEDTEGLVKGKLKLDAFFPIQSDRKVSFNIKGKGYSKGAKLYGFRLLDSSLEYQIDSDKIAFKNVKVKKDNRQYGTGSGSIYFDRPYNFTFRFKPNKLPLRMLMHILEIDGFEAVDAIITSSNIAVSGQVLPFRVKVSGPTFFNDLWLPIIDFDEKTYKKRSSCYLDVNLSFDSKKVDFIDNAGYCFGEREPKSIVKPKDALKDTQWLEEDLAVEERQNLSKLKLLGAIYFDPLKGMALDIEFSSFDARLLRYISQTEISGNIDLTLSIYGPFEDIGLDFKGDFTDFFVRKIKLGRVQGNVSIPTAKGLMKFNQIKISPERKMNISLSNGILRYNDDYDFSGNITATRIYSDFVQQIFLSFFPDIRLKFAVANLAGKIRGKLLFPFSYKGNLNIEFVDGRFGKESIFSHIKGVVEATDRAILAQKLYYTNNSLKTEIYFNLLRSKPFAPQESANIFESMGFNLEDKVRFRLKTIKKNRANEGPIDVYQSQQHLANIPIINKYFEKIPLNGDIVCDVDLDGDLRRLQGKFKGVIENLSVFGGQVAPVGFEGFVSGSKIDIPIFYHSGRSILGRIDFDFLKPRIPYKWYFNFDRFDLRALGTNYFANDPRNYAYITADWRMQGYLADFWHSQGRLSIEDLRIKWIHDIERETKKSVIKLQRPVSVIIDEDGWNLSGNQDFTLKGEDLLISIATKGNRPPDKLAVFTKGELDLSFLKEHFAMMEIAKGKLDIKGSIINTIENPDISINISDIESQEQDSLSREPIVIGFEELPPPFRNIACDIRYRNGVIEIRKITAEKGKKGRVSVVGTLKLGEDINDTSTINITLNQIEIKRLPIAILRSLDATLSGDLTLKGNTTPLKLSGNINVDRANSSGSFDIRKQIIESINARKFHSSTIAPKDPIFDLSIRLTSEDSVRIRNQNLSGVLSSDLFITSNENAPKIAGLINVSKGKFKYKRDFTVQRGNIAFDGTLHPPDPKLDILGETQAGAYRVLVAISGKASSPKVSLTIDPPTKSDGTTITKMDILTLLSTGKLPDSTRNVSASEDRAMIEAANLAISPFEEPIEKLLGLSGQKVIKRVYIDTYLSETDGKPIYRFSLPIRSFLDDDLNTVIQVDTEENLKGLLEYSLHENISVSGSFDKKHETREKDSNLPTDTGVDIKFRFNFP